MRSLLKQVEIYTVEKWPGRKIEGTFISEEKPVNGAHPLKKLIPFTVIQ